MTATAIKSSPSAVQRSDEGVHGGVRSTGGTPGFVNDTSLERLKREALRHELWSSQGTSADVSTSLPTSFRSVGEYVAAFEPLLFEECRAQVLSQWEEAAESATALHLQLKPVSLEMSHRGWWEVWLSQGNEGRVGEGRNGFQNRDGDSTEGRRQRRLPGSFKDGDSAVLSSLNPRHTHRAQSWRIAGIIRCQDSSGDAHAGTGRSPLIFTFHPSALPPGKSAKELLRVHEGGSTGGLSIFLTPIGNMTTAQREFDALRSVHRLPPKVLDVLLCPSPKLFPDYSHSNPPDLTSSTSPAFISYLQSSFNEPQLRAIHWAAAPSSSPTAATVSLSKGRRSSSEEEEEEQGHKEWPFTLVQGPPGTGKTHTVWGMLNAIHLLHYQQHYSALLHSLGANTLSTPHPPTHPHPHAHPDTPSDIPDAPAPLPTPALAPASHGPSEDPILENESLNESQQEAEYSLKEGEEQEEKKGMGAEDVQQEREEGKRMEEEEEKEEEKEEEEEEEVEEEEVVVVFKRPRSNTRRSGRASSSNIKQQHLWGMDASRVTMPNTTNASAAAAGAGAGAGVNATSGGDSGVSREAKRQRVGAGNSSGTSGAPRASGASGVSGIGVGVARGGKTAVTVSRQDRDRERVRVSGNESKSRVVRKNVVGGRGLGRGTHKEDQRRLSGNRNKDEGRVGIEEVVEGMQATSAAAARSRARESSGHMGHHKTHAAHDSGASLSSSSAAAAAAAAQVFAGVHKPRILVCAPSNAAVDEMLTRVLDKGFLDGELRVYRPDVARIGADTVSPAAKAVSVEQRTEALLAMPAAECYSHWDTLQNRLQQLHWEVVTLMQDLTTLTHQNHILEQKQRQKQNQKKQQKAQGKGLEQGSKKEEGAEEERQSAQVIKGANGASGADADAAADADADADADAREAAETQIEVHTLEQQKATILQRLAAAVEAQHKAQVESDRLTLVCSLSRRPLAPAAPGIGTGIGMPEGASSSVPTLGFYEGSLGNRAHVRTQLETSFADEAEIIFTTASSSGRRIMSKLTHSFDVLVIDEAAQASEVAVLPPLVLGCARCVLVGDPQQLPATVISRTASALNYSRSLFERFQSQGCPTILLTLQFRMHPAIRAFPSSFFYNNQLQDAPSLVSRPDEPYHADALLRPFLFFDVPSEGGNQQPHTRSYSNTLEAQTALALFLHLQSTSFKLGASGPVPVGVATPYRQQLKLLRSLFQEQAEKASVTSTPQQPQHQQQQQQQQQHQQHLVGPKAPGAFQGQMGSLQGQAHGGTQGQSTSTETQEEQIQRAAAAAAGSPFLYCNTVDAFQGQERDVIILSCVRASTRSLGFVADTRRLNVAITRARRALWVLGNTAALQQSPAWSALIAEARSRGCLLSWEEFSPVLFPNKRTNVEVHDINKHKYHHSHRNSRR